MFVGIGMSLVSRLKAATAAAAFNPVSLFAAGEEGALFLPGPTTSFLSTTDLTPAGAGDTVGFQLDTSQGAGYSGGSFTGLGSELVTNGTFDTDVSGWTATRATTSISSGAMRVTSTDANGFAKQGPITVEVGKTYFYSFDITAIEGINSRLQMGSSNNSSSYIIGSNVGSFSGVFVATTEELHIRIYAEISGDPGDYIEVDNISVRELPGNHAVQTTAAARPVLARVPSGGRRNLLERTEEFDNAYWSKLRSTITANAATAPDGTTTAEDFQQASGETSSGLVERTISWSSAQTFSVYVKPNGKNWVFLQTQAGGSPRRTWFDISTGAVGTTNASHTAAISDEGDGWYRCSVADAAGSVVTVYLADADNSVTVTDSGGIYIWGAQLEEGSTATAYQKVASEYDVTEAGVDSLWYLDFDGVDDHFDLSISNPAGPVSIFLGAKADSGESTNRAYVIDIESGRLILGLPASQNGYAGFFDGDWRDVDINTETENVLSALVYASGGQFRVNGSSLLSGSYNELPIGGSVTIGAANTGSARFLDGRIYGLILRFATSTAQEISDTETFLADRSGVTL
jgi:hypothetical protein